VIVVRTPEPLRQADLGHDRHHRIIASLSVFEQHTGRAQEMTGSCAGRRGRGEPHHSPPARRRAQPTD